MQALRRLAHLHKGHVESDILNSAGGEGEYIQKPHFFKFIPLFKAPQQAAKLSFQKESRSGFFCLVAGGTLGSLQKQLPHLEVPIEQFE